MEFFISFDNGNYALVTLARITKNLYVCESSLYGWKFVIDRFTGYTERRDGNEVVPYGNCTASTMKTLRDREKEMLTC